MLSINHARKEEGVHRTIFDYVTHYVTTDFERKESLRVSNQPLTRSVDNKSFLDEV